MASGTGHTERDAALELSHVRRERRRRPRRRKSVRRAALVIVLGLVAIGAWVGIRDVRRLYWTTRGAEVERFTVQSSAAKRDLHEILVVPRGGGQGKELLVFLQGRSSGPKSNLRQSLFDALHDLGPRAPAVLLADGGDHSYWHDRRDGAWGTAMLREVIPAALDRSGADPKRVAIGGISMGGFGALHLARVAPNRFCAVGAHSAALWFRGGDTPEGAFDDAEAFARNDLIRFARDRRLYNVPVWIDVGREDGFARANVAFAKAVRSRGTRVRLWVHGGGHGGWSGRMSAYLQFCAAACRSTG